MLFTQPRKARRVEMHTISAALLKVPRARTTIAQRLGVTPRCVENWLAGSSQPSASNLVDLMRHFDVVSDAVLHMAGRRPLTDAQINAAKQALKLLEDI